MLNLYGKYVQECMGLTKNDKRPFIYPNWQIYKSQRKNWSQLFYSWIVDENTGFLVSLYFI